MSTTVHVAATARSNMWSGTGINTILGASSHLVIYSGTAPADADTALSGNTLLVSLPLAATPVTSTTSGVATLGAITSAAAAATGTASFWRLLDSQGSPVCQYQGDVSATGGSGSLQLATVSIVAAATISCSSGSLTLPA